jgi:hypothetical protein
MRSLLWLGVLVILLWSETAVGANSVVVQAPSSASRGTVEIPVFLTNDVALRAVVVPLIIRSISGEPFLDTLKLSFRDRLPPDGPLSDLSFANRYDEEDGGCKRFDPEDTLPAPGGFETVAVPNDTTPNPVHVMPVGVMFSRLRILGAALPVGADTAGSLLLTMHVNVGAADQPGLLEIDTTCVGGLSALNHHLLLSDLNGLPVEITFVGDTLEVTCVDAGIGAPSPASLFHQDGAMGPDSVTLKWGAVSGAVAYEVRMDTEDGSFENIWLQTVTVEESLSVEIPGGGPLYWQVKGLGEPPNCDGPWTSPSVYTHVENLVSTMVPETHRLHQNHPNPFNSSTIIQFANKRDSQVRLDIYNILGQKVITLIDGFRIWGTYAVEWDGKDEAGQAVPSGLYFYRVTTGDFTAVKKMVLLK